jgi:hypothetical protein
MTSTSSSNHAPSYQPLLDLPEELLPHIIGSFCTGKSISTLLLATLSCPHHGDVMRSSVRQVLRERIVLVIDRAAFLPSSLRIHRFLQELILGHDDAGGSGQEGELHLLRYLSTRLAVVDYFEHGLNATRKGEPIQFPVWTGTLNIAHYSSLGDWGHPAGVQVQLATPFWNPNLAGAFLNSIHSSFGMKVIPQMRNFRTVPPIGRLEGIQDLDVASIKVIKTRMAEHDEVLAPQFIFTVGQGVSFFLVTDDQARQHCPSYLPDRLDPYNLKENAALAGGNEETKQSSRGAKSEMYCLWMQTNDDDGDVDDIRSIHDVMDDMIQLMKRINLVRKSAMQPLTYT